MIIQWLFFRLRIKFTRNNKPIKKGLVPTFPENYNLFNFLRPYAEAGTNGSDVAYGSGFSIPIFNDAIGLEGGLQLYLPLITEEGIVDFKDYKNVLRFNVSFKIVTS